MRFSIKSRVESLIKRGRILAAIRKLQHFTKDKADHQQTYNTLNELESRFIQIEQDSKSGVLDYATFDRERSKIRSAVLDINNEIVELKETKDRKFLKWLIGIATAVITIVLGILIQQWFDRSEHCPTFEDKDCKLLIFKFPESSVGGTHDRINQILNTDESSFVNISSAVHLGDERSPNNAAFEKALNACNADFALSGDAKDLGDNRLIYLYPYSKEKGDLMETSLATFVDELRDTIKLTEEPADIAQERQFQLMLQLIACWTDCVDCKDDLNEIQEVIMEIDPEFQVNVSLLYASYFHNESHFQQAERLLTNVINSLTAPIKTWAYRGKVRDDQKKYQPAFQDYSYYLDEKPENHNVRLKRFTSAYNLLMTSPWQMRFAEYVDIAADDLKLLKGNVSEQEYRLAESRLMEMQKLKDKNMAVADHATPGTVPQPPIRQCDYVFQVKNTEGQVIKDALVSVMGHESVLTNEQGMVEFMGVPCNGFTDNKFTVAKSGYEPYQSQVKEGSMAVVLNASPDPDPMCAFSGEVLDEKGQPIFYATVTVEGLSAMLTDKDGRFKSQTEPCGELDGRKFTIVANGYDPLEDVIRNMNMTYSLVPEKPEYCTFSGTIKNNKGITIKDATISVFGIDKVDSKYNGAFEIKNIPCDDFIGRDFNVYASGYKTYTSKIRDSQSIITMEPEISLCTFSGKVNDQAGKGISNATIDIQDNSSLKPDINGNFKISSDVCENLIGKSYSIKAKGYQSIRGVIQENNLYVTHTLKRDVANYQISGRVVNALNIEPLSQSAIYINDDLMGRTDKEGNFALDFAMGTNESSVAVKCIKNGFHTKSFSLNLAKIGYQNIELTPAGVGGRIVDNNNKSIEGATIRIRGLKNQTSNKNGDFSFTVPNGFSFPETVEAVKSGFQTANVPIATIYRIELTPNLTMIGHVLDTKVMAVLQQILYVEATRPYNKGWAIGAEVYLDGKKAGTIQKDGRLSLNMTGKVNQTFNIRVVYKGLKAMTKKVKFTHNGQVVKFDLEPVG